MSGVVNNASYTEPSRMQLLPRLLAPGTQSTILVLEMLRPGPSCVGEPATSCLRIGVWSIVENEAAAGGRRAFLHVSGSVVHGLIDANEW